VTSNFGAKPCFLSSLRISRRAARMSRRGWTSMSSTGLSAEQMARMEREMDGLQREFKAVSASYGDTVLNLVVAAGYLSSLIGNLRLSGYLGRHHPEILTEFRAIVATTSLEENGSGASEEPAFLG
jgi:hypothetical protein